MPFDYYSLEDECPTSFDIPPADREAARDITRLVKTCLLIMHDCQISKHNTVEHANNALEILMNVGLWQEAEALLHEILPPIQEWHTLPTQECVRSFSILGDIMLCRGEADLALEVLNVWLELYEESLMKTSSKSNISHHSSTKLSEPMLLNDVDPPPMVAYWSLAHSLIQYNLDDYQQKCRSSNRWIALEQ